jgi:hypothetical protein
MLIFAVMVAALGILLALQWAMGSKWVIAAKFDSGPNNVFVDVVEAELRSNDIEPRFHAPAAPNFYVEVRQRDLRRATKILRALRASHPRYFEHIDGDQNPR